MNVSELITLLSKQNPHALVVLSATEGGVNECQTAIGVKVLLHSATNWHPGLGEHEISFQQIKQLSDNECAGVLIQ